MKLQLQTRSSQRIKPKPRQPNPALTLLAGIAAVVMGTSGALLVALTVLFRGRWELLDLIALAINLALLMLGLQLLSWSLSGSEDSR